VATDCPRYNRPAVSWLTQREDTQNQSTRQPVSNFITINAPKCPNTRPFTLICTQDDKPHDITNANRLQKITLHRILDDRRKQNWSRDGRDLSLTPRGSAPWPRDLTSYWISYSSVYNNQKRKQQLCRMFRMSVEVLFSYEKERIKGPEDAVVCCLHCYMTINGYKCIGNGETVHVPDWPLLCVIKQKLVTMVAVWLTGNSIEHSYCTSGPVSTWMGDRLRRVNHFCI